MDILFIFDFLLTLRSVIFTPFDKKTYKKDIGFYCKYQSVTPGFKCKDWNDVFNWIKKFKGNPNYYSLDRLKARYIFHKYFDDNSSKRVYDQINSII